MNDTLYKEESSSNYLLVEGSDDAQVFFHLLQHHHLSKHIKIEKKVGIEKLLEDINAPHAQRIIQWLRQLFELEEA